MNSAAFPNRIGNWQVIELRGQGAFGRVYKVEQGGVVRAMKVFAKAHLNAEDHLRAEREIRTYQKVVHPAIARYYESGTFMDGTQETMYLVIEWVEGRTIRELLRSAGPMSVEAIARIGIAIAEAVQALHRAAPPIIHRDLNSNNVMITVSGDVKLLDFGVARLIDYTTITASPRPVGMLSYSPPEVFGGSHGDESADVYGLGVLLYEMATGQFPFQGPTQAALLGQIVNQAPPSPSSIRSDLPTPFEQLILRMLAKDSLQRPPLDAICVALGDPGGPTRVAPTLTIPRTSFMPLPMGNEGGPIERVSGYLGRPIDGMVFQANLAVYNKAVLDRLRPFVSNLAIDPQTYRLQHSAFSGVKTVRELPWVTDKVNREEAADYDQARIEWHVQRLIAFAKTKKVDVLLVSFHHVRNAADEWLEVDRRLLATTLAECARQQVNVPVFYGLSMPAEELTTDRGRALWLQRMAALSPDGYFLHLEMSRNANPAQVAGYARFVQRLSERAPVIVSRIGSVGIGLLAAGAWAMSSGLAALESWEEALVSDPGPGGYSPPARYYVPRLLTGVPRATIEDLTQRQLLSLIECDCPVCVNRGNLQLWDFPVVKGHYLYHRIKETEQLRAVGKTEQLHWFKGKLAVAVSESKKFMTALGPGTRPVPGFDELARWQDAFSQL